MLRRHSQKKISFSNIQSTIVFPKIQNKRMSQIKTSAQPKRSISKQSKDRQKYISTNQIKIKKLEKVIPALKIENITKSIIGMQQIPSLVQKKKKITAQAYGVYDKQLTPITQFNSRQKRQIASLTKIMTLLATLRLCEKFRIQLNTTYFRISVNASITNGTIAELDPKQWITIQDLLYGLMLPSGNDAAIAISQNLGAFLYYERQGQAKALTQIKSLDITNDPSINLRIYCQNFVNYMNKLAKQFQMINTMYINPHGLDCPQAYSTVQDVSILMSKIIENQIAFKIICQKTYTARLKNLIGKKQINFRQVTWLNTNKLIGKEGYIGGKTGQTVNAGNCLASIYQKQGKKYFIIVLGCSGRQDRFSQTEQLINEEILKNI